MTIFDENGTFPLCYSKNGNIFDITRKRESFVSDRRIDLETRRDVASRRVAAS